MQGVLLRVVCIEGGDFALVEHFKIACIVAEGYDVIAHLEIGAQEAEVINAVLVENLEIAVVGDIGYQVIAGNVALRGEALRRNGFAVVKYLEYAAGIGIAYGIAAGAEGGDLVIFLRDDLAMVEDAELARVVVVGGHIIGHGNGGDARARKVAFYGVDLPVVVGFVLGAHAIEEDHEAIAHIILLTEEGEVFYNAFVEYVEGFCIEEGDEVIGNVEGVGEAGIEGAHAAAVVNFKGAGIIEVGDGDTAGFELSGWQVIYLAQEAIIPNHKLALEVGICCELGDCRDGKK